jgi:hypothetical protein
MDDPPATKNAGTSAKKRKRIRSIVLGTSRLAVVRSLVDWLVRLDSYALWQGAALKMKGLNKKGADQPGSAPPVLLTR